MIAVFFFVSSNVNNEIHCSSFQLQRYEAYGDRLQRHFQQLQLDHPYLKTDQHGNRSFIGPLEAISGVNNSLTPNSNSHQLLPGRTNHNTSIGYKKTSQSPTLTMTNPNRYSYMMAVNTHPVPMKEHRL